MNRTSATVVADSVAYGHRLTTLELVMHPRAVEHFLTHRALSRNGASRRAIPLHKQIAEVRDHDCFPAKFGREQRGMVSGEELAGDDLISAQREWRLAKAYAIEAARRLGSLGVHKETASAPIHPFMWRTYLVSATEWEGFLRQRLTAEAQADIRLVAKAVDQALNNSTPRQLAVGEWHLPYINFKDRLDCARHGVDPRVVSAMRCARVSYLSHPVLDEAGVVLQDSKRDVREDHAKGVDLASREHWSPFEHPATPVMPPAPTANFRGWQQLRTQMGA